MIILVIVCVMVCGFSEGLLNSSLWVEYSVLIVSCKVSFVCVGLMDGCILRKGFSIRLVIRLCECSCCDCSVGMVCCVCVI